MALSPAEAAAIARARARHGRPFGVVLDVGFTNGLSAIRALVGAGAPVVAVDHRPDALGLRARGAIGVQAPDPGVDEAGYLAVLAAVGEAVGTGVAFPTQDRGVVLLAREADRLPGLRLPGSGWGVLEPLLRKATQLDAARRVGVPVPATHAPTTRAEVVALAGSIGYPAIIKPDLGLGFKARERRPVVEVADGDELLAAWDRHAPFGERLLVQDVIPGDDDRLWTVGSYTAEGGSSLGVFCGRKLSQLTPRFGTCRVGEARWSDEAVDLAGRLLREVGYDGISQVEFKLDPRDGTFRLMEINTRLWQWHSLARRCGVDLVAMAYRGALGEPVASARSGPRFDGKRWVPVVPSWRAGRANGETRRTAIAPMLGAIEEPIISLRDPLPGLTMVGGFARATVRNRVRRLRGARS